MSMSELLCWVDLWTSMSGNVWGVAALSWRNRLSFNTEDFNISGTGQATLRCSIHAHTADI